MKNLKIALKIELARKIKIMLVRSLQYFKKIRGCQSKNCEICDFFVLARFRLRIMRIRGFATFVFRLWVFGFACLLAVGLCGPFLVTKKIFSEICKKLLTFPFRCAILEANNGFGVFILRSLLRKILTFFSEAFPLCNLPITSTPL